MAQKLHLVSTYTCPYVQRARIILNEKNTPYEITYIDLTQKPDWFQEMSPLGTVPVMRVQDEENNVDTTLFESQVICEYLDETQQPALHPQKPLDRALNRAWIEYGSKLVSAQAGYTFAANEGAQKEKLDSIKSMLARVEDLLSKRNNDGPMFNGEQMALIDAAYAPFFMRNSILEKVKPIGLLDAYPHVKEWSEALITRESVKKSVVETFEEEIRKRVVARGGYMADLFPN